jgi:hypothetical protein
MLVLIKNINKFCLLCCFKNNDQMKDDGCPTCGSKDYGTIEIKKESSGSSKWKMQCYNCKKFWYTSNS